MQACSVSFVLVTCCGMGRMWLTHRPPVNCLFWLKIAQFLYLLWPFMVELIPARRTERRPQKTRSWSDCVLRHLIQQCWLCLPFVLFCNDSFKASRSIQALSYQRAKAAYGRTRSICAPFQRILMTLTKGRAHVVRDNRLSSASFPST